MNTDYTKAIGLLDEVISLYAAAGKDVFADVVSDTSDTEEEAGVYARELMERVQQFMGGEGPGSSGDHIHDVGDTIYYLRKNRVHSAPVLSYQLVSVRADTVPPTKASDRLLKPFGPSGVRYATCHGIVLGEEAFGSRDELVDSLKDGS